MKFRKKPVVIEAVQWFPGVEHPGVHVMPAHDVPSRSGGTAFRAAETHYVITIHEQKSFLSPGDWIIPEPKEGRYYPCKDDIFRATYEKAE